jgi:F0F1-type ATP synthase assembly protein I
MMILIGGGAYLGNYLDEKYGNETPWFAIALSLFGILTSLYLVLKEVKKSS